MRRSWAAALINPRQIWVSTWQVTASLTMKYARRLPARRSSDGRKTAARRPIPRGDFSDSSHSSNSSNSSCSQSSSFNSLTTSTLDSESLDFLASSSCLQAGIRSACLISVQAVSESTSAPSRSFSYSSIFPVVSAPVSSLSASSSLLELSSRSLCSIFPPSRILFRRRFLYSFRLFRSVFSIHFRCHFPTQPYFEDSFFLKINNLLQI